MTIAKKRVEAFIKEHAERIESLKERISKANERIEYLQLEVNYLQSEEIPKAEATEVLEGTTGHVAKLTKSLQRFKTELADKQREVTILANAISQFQYQQGEQALLLDRQYKEERLLEESKAYNKMMKAKKDYIDTILAESEELREMSKVDVQLQQILIDAGRRSNIYSSLEVKGSPTASSKGNHQNIYLGLDFNEVKRYVAGTYSPDDYDYLKKFSHANKGV